jgi:hypothetical protein
MSAGEYKKAANLFWFAAFFFLSLILILWHRWVDLIGPRKDTAG